MTHTLTCTIPQKPIAYEIVIKNNLLQDAAFLTSLLKPFGKQFALITTEKIAPLYADRLSKTLEAHACSCTVFSIPSGEEYKTRQVKEEIENKMFSKNMGRDTCLIAMGGGVVTDLAGFIAATYCRGLPFVSIPTTLLGMVDASLGGKTGVNVPYGKNLVGAIYQPKMVLIDPSTLVSLPIKELKNGSVEMIKHGLIADAHYFDFLEEHLDQTLALDPTVLQKAIVGSCQIKKSIVEEDEKEGGKRHLLNFGHTVAHALETLTHYSMAHGEAVALGLLAEAHMAVQIGELKQKDLERLQKLVNGHQLAGKIPKDITPAAIANAMVLDKKSLQGKPRFVIIKKIGTPLTYGGAYCAHVDDQLILKALEWIKLS